jgi:hypothetical protein
MRKVGRLFIAVSLLAAPLFGQAKHLWVLRSTGEMVEYDPETFVAKQTVKLPAEAGKSPADVSVNRAGQILFSPVVSLPLSAEDAAAAHKIWFWNGHLAATIDQGVERKIEETGSNEAVSELAPAACLSADGSHLFWFANQTRRLQRDDVDLSIAVTWQAWQTDLGGMGHEELASIKIPECGCPTGNCEETCPEGVVWTPEAGVETFFVITQFVAGQASSVYKASALYREGGGKWNAEAFTEPLQRVLDADSSGKVIVEAIPDTGCCGWSNQSNDQTLVLANGKKLIVFDEQATYKNPDYDVSFYTSRARLSPQGGSVAMTIAATTPPNKPIQLSQDGQASPEESERIRKGLEDLPAVAVKSVEETPRQIAFLPHATLVGWINEKELLIVEDHVLVTYHVATGARRKSSVRVEDAARVFLL